MIHDGRQSRVTVNPATGGHLVYGVDFGHVIGSGNWSAASLAAQPLPTALLDPNGWTAGVGPGCGSAAAAKVRSLADEELARIIAAVPAAWNVPVGDRDALLSYLAGRREAVAVLLEKLG
jgi:hypothetical protein